MKLLSIAMLIAAGASAGWTVHLRRIGDPAWKLSLGAALCALAGGVIAPRIEAAIFALVCVMIASSLVLSFQRGLPHQPPH